MDCERPRHEAALEQFLSALASLRRDLVLDCDMRPPAAGILGAKRAVEGLGELLADQIQLRRNDPERDSAAKIHQPFDRRCRRGLTRKLAPSRARNSPSADGGSAWNMVRCAGSWLRSGG